MPVNNKTVKQYFSQKIVEWHKKHNKRKMPWKEEKDPYKIWLSEIILQQTRVEQGTAYYNRFVNQYPTVKHLAEAKDEEVFKLWEGLGYYARCKNLLASARFINKNGGIFPQKYEDVLALKGVGTYTAAAIVSFAYNQPYAVVDGNVSRVLARFFGIKTAIDGTAGKKLMHSLAHELLNKKQPGKFNQAMMDFGATICKPKLPLCASCLLQSKCFALKHHKINELPVKEKKTTLTNRWMYYLIATYKNGVYIHKRTAKDIWQNLHEFILIESGKKLSEPQLLQHPLIKKFAPGSNPALKVSKEFSQKLSHQRVTGKFIQVTLLKKTTIGDYEWVPKKSIKDKAFTGFINQYLKSLKTL